MPRTEQPHEILGIPEKRLKSISDNEVNLRYKMKRYRLHREHRLNKKATCNPLPKITLDFFNKYDIDYLKEAWLKLNSQENRIIYANSLLRQENTQETIHNSY